MEVTIKLFATLREGRGKILTVDIPRDATAHTIIEQLSIPESDVAILLINGMDKTLNTPIPEGATIAIFPPVGGG